MGEKDTTSKILLAYTDVFSDIVNGLLFNGKQIIRPDDLEDQAEDDPDMVLRVYGYDGAEYRTQLLKENKDHQRYPVVTLVLYFGYKKHWKAPLRLHEAVDIPDILKPYVADIKINVFEIAYLSDEQLSRFHSDFRIVADYFVQMQRNGDYIPSREEIDHVEAVLQLLRIMTDDSRFEDVLNEEDGTESEGGIHNMCEVLDRVEAKGKAIGEKNGAIKEAVRIYHDEMNLSPIDIEKKIMARFKLEQSEAERYVEETLG